MIRLLVSLSAVLGALLISSPQASLAASAGASAESLGARYTSVLTDCGRGRQSGVLFFTAFGGMWPLPSNFVLVDIANEQLEYSDLAFPWDDPPKWSHVFYGRRSAVEEAWPSLFSAQLHSQPGLCGVEVRRYPSSVEFGTKPVVVVSGRHDHLVLVGPITESLQTTMECFAATKRRVGYPC